MHAGQKSRLHQLTSSTYWGASFTYSCIPQWLTGQYILWERQGVYLSEKHLPLHSCLPFAGLRSLNVLIIEQRGACLRCWEVRMLSVGKYVDVEYMIKMVYSATSVVSEWYNSAGQSPRSGAWRQAAHCSQGLVEWHNTADKMWGCPSRSCSPGMLL